MRITGEIPKSLGGFQKAVWGVTGGRYSARIAPLHPLQKKAYALIQSIGLFNAINPLQDLLHLLQIVKRQVIVK